MACEEGHRENDGELEALWAYDPLGALRPVPKNWALFSLARFFDMFFRPKLCITGPLSSSAEREVSVLGEREKRPRRQNAHTHDPQGYLFLDKMSAKDNPPSDSVPLRALRTRMKVCGRPPFLFTHTCKKSQCLILLARYDVVRMQG